MKSVLRCKITNVIIKAENKSGGNNHNEKKSYQHLSLRRDGCDNGACFFRYRIG